MVKRIIEWVNPDTRISTTNKSCTQLGDVAPLYKCSVCGKSVIKYGVLASRRYYPLGSIQYNQWFHISCFIRLYDIGAVPSNYPELTEFKEAFNKALEKHGELLLAEEI